MGLKKDVEGFWHLGLDRSHAVPISDSLLRGLRHFPATRKTRMHPLVIVSTDMTRDNRNSPEYGAQRLYAKRKTRLVP